MIRQLSVTPSHVPASQAPWPARPLGRALLLALLVTLLTALLPGATRAAATGSWSETGGLQTARLFPVAVTLTNGKALVIGGRSLFGTLGSSELYDPVTKTWSQTSSMGTERWGHTATVLASGKVLVIGGGDNNALSSAELYDPATAAWTPAASMGTARRGHTATLLLDGRVLVTGGSGNGILASAEIYNPALNTWTPVATMHTIRRDHTAVRLGDGTGRVLVAGGTGAGGALASAEIYSPAFNTWTPIAGMNAARATHTMTLLNNGKMLVVGGLAAPNILASAELYDLATNSWTQTGSMAVARTYHTANRLADGRVLVVGGMGAGLLAASELYDPATGIWTATGGLTNARATHTSTMLGNTVMIIGGTGLVGGGNPFLNTAELFDPSGSAPTYPITLAMSGPGTATAAPSGAEQPDGMTVVFQANPDAGAVFVGWTVDGAFEDWDQSLPLIVRGPRAVSAAFATRPSYSDVPDGNEAQEAIIQLGARGIVKGYGDGRFGPGDPVLRAQMAALIARAMRWDAEDHGNSFPDQGAVDTDLWRNVGTLAYYGVAKGYPDGSYDPTGPVLRAQVISFITRAMVAEGYWELQPDDPAIYLNVPIDSGHRADIATYVHYAGALPDQSNSSFDGWDQPATRAWFARALWSALDQHFGPPEPFIIP